MPKAEEGGITPKAPLAVQPDQELVNAPVELPEEECDESKED